MRSADRRLVFVRPRVLALLLWLALFGIAQAGNFDTGNQSYDAGKFADAKAAYQQAVASGAWSANLFYNLGNAEFRLGESGAAMLAYERALALEPAHAEAAANLKLLRARTGAAEWPQSWLDAIFPAHRIDVYVVLAAVAGWVLIFLLAGIAFSPRGEKVGRWFASVLAFLVTAYAAVGVWRAGAERAQAIVTANSAEVRLAPTETAAAAGVLPAGSEVRVLGVRGDWTYCALPTQRRGWIPSNALELVRMGES